MFDFRADNKDVSQVENNFAVNLVDLVDSDDGFEFCNDILDDDPDEERRAMIRFASIDDDIQENFLIYDSSKQTVNAESFRTAEKKPSGRKFEEIVTEAVKKDQQNVLTSINLESISESNASCQFQALSSHIVI